MEIKKQYIEKYLYSIAIDQLSDEYIKKGYEIRKDYKVGKFQVDLIAKNDKEIIVFEIKTSKLTSEKKKAIAEIGNYVRKHNNYRFLLVIATAPKNKELQIDGIETELFNSFIDDMPDDLDILSTHTSIEEIVDVDIDEINISDKFIFVKGDGVVNIQLQFGSDGDQDRDDGFKMYDSYPFDFEIIMKYENGFKIIEINSLNIDTSSFYE